MSNKKPPGNRIAITISGDYALAGVEGIEPSLKVLETSVIPFDHTPVVAGAKPAKVIIAKKQWRVNSEPSGVWPIALITRNPVQRKVIVGNYGFA